MMSWRLMGAAKMKAPADASNGRGLLVPAIDRKLPMAGRRPANSCRGGNGEGAGRKGGNSEPIKAQVGSINYLHATQGVMVPRTPAWPVLSLLFTGATRARPARHALIVGRARMVLLAPWRR